MSGDFQTAVADAERQQLIRDLQNARAELISRGWAQWDFIAHDGRVCALGALGVATVEDFDQLPVYQQEAIFQYGWWPDRESEFEPRMARARAALEQMLPPPHFVHDFNDFDAETVEDILDLFDKTLAELGGL